MNSVVWEASRDIPMNYITMLPPLRVSHALSPSNSIPHEQNISLDFSSSKPSLRERNKLAARKWRSKKEAYLNDAEERNDVLREEALKLTNIVRKLTSENLVLETELKFFQNVLSRAMGKPPM